MTKNESTDPVLDEIRNIRRQISAQFEHDPYKLAAYYEELQQKYKDRLLKTNAPKVEIKDSPAA